MPELKPYQQKIQEITQALENELSVIEEIMWKDILDAPLEDLSAAGPASW